MNDVTSLEVSKELYAISGWDEGRLEHSVVTPESATGIGDFTTIPKYPLGYLLRKLPPELSGYQMKDEKLGNHRKLKYIVENLYLILEPSVGDAWVAGYSDRDFSRKIYEVADTPEDAAAMLAIELFKQGVSKKGGR